ncbi:hypothetical protein LS74_000325 [Helicobacter magdeburgensis]|uniref:DUF1640 domain-containing protein n=2 Tax=Helicobacter TaxID=209 RepID=A0A4V6I1W2_9HELI|nr:MULTISPECIES: hypothetical protein [Helicobacter]EFR45888.1 hypothetical protein HCCG_00434 [Helicobacter cinaedi CCUG 18818 = ATCC BAA-847]QOQ90849.1 hypothetical protein HW260_00295 [Helicobacter cinaedi]TLD93832.1 hypothetical protein LS74_000325 [Helicobacter magdeburgensis]BAM33248.1 hypothetical protein HCBAA847_2030 [Helicobacter cinaedi CCUG 18818 = ATCC BAA-847]BDB64112.1 hypothetical protein T36_0559 [Helicobacter cinaedi]
MKHLTLSQSSMLVIENFINKHFHIKDETQRQNTIQDGIQMAQAILQDIDNEKILTANELKEEAIEKIKGELATKDFVRAEITEAKQELKTQITEVKQELKADIQNLRLEMAEFKSGMIKWIVGVGISAALISTSANATLIMFLLQQLKP